MKKIITIEVETEEENQKILYYLDKWIIDNFQNPEKVKLSIEPNERDNK